MGTVPKLTARQVLTLTRPGRYGDGGNLYLKVGPTGGKSWVFRYMRDGQSFDMGLGPASLVSLAEARDAAHLCRRRLHNGQDPIEHRDAGKGTAPVIPTFEEFAEGWIDDNERRWRNAKGAPQWRSSLAAYAYPILGDLPVDRIATGHVLDVLKPIWTAKPETARKVRTRVGQLLDAAKALGYRTGDNPAGWRGNLRDLLPPQAKTIEHHAALPYAKVPAFIKQLRKRAGIAAVAFEFLILTMTRTSEVTGARHDEIDTKAKAWTIPAGRTKANREHRVPLSDRALEILAALPAGGPFVFAGRSPGKALSNMAFLTLLRRMGRTDITAHGFRSAARDWAAEQTSYQREVLEHALAHTVGNEVERSYARGTMFEKRRALMNEWAAYCTTG